MCHCAARCWWQAGVLANNRPVTIQIDKPLDALRAVQRNAADQGVTSNKYNCK